METSSENIKFCSCKPTLWDAVCQEADWKRPPFRPMHSGRQFHKVDKFTSSKISPSFVGYEYHKSEMAVAVDETEVHPAFSGYCYQKEKPAEYPAPDAPSKDKCTPLEYLDFYIFPILLPALEALLIKAKNENQITRKQIRMNNMDYLTEYLYRNNSKHPGRSGTEFLDIPFVKEQLTDQPRRELPLSLKLTEDEAATIIQAGYRGYQLRKNPEVVELRAYQTEMKQLQTDIHTRIQMFWQKFLKGRKRLSDDSIIEVRMPTLHEIPQDILSELEIVEQEASARTGDHYCGDDISNFLPCCVEGMEADTVVYKSKTTHVTILPGGTNVNIEDALPEPYKEHELSLSTIPRMPDYNSTPKPISALPSELEAESINENHIIVKSATPVTGKYSHSIPKLPSSLGVSQSSAGPTKHSA